MKTRQRNSLAPVSIVGTRIKPKNTAHRKKLQAFNFFVRQLRASPLSKHIARVVLFGSVAKGTAKRESDIDVLLFTRIREDEKFKDARYDIEQTVWEKLGEHIETHVHPFAEYKNPTSYLVYRATRHGDAFKPKRAQWLKEEEVRDRIKRAQEDLAAGSHLLAQFPRGALMPVYNAAEGCAKALILCEADDLPGSRHGIVAALKKTRARAFMPRLRQALKWHIEAAYEPTDSIGTEETNAVIALAEEMLAYLKDSVREQP